VIGTSGAATHTYHQYPFSMPMVLLMGSERQGLTEAHVALCDDVVKIPMVGRSDSLNLAIATAVVLYEIFNQTHL
jgi:TrmH family RNA methyltransferase